MRRAKYLLPFIISYHNNIPDIAKYCQENDWNRRIEKSLLCSKITHWGILILKMRKYIDNFSGGKMARGKGHYRNWVINLELFEDLNFMYCSKQIVIYIIFNFTHI